MTKFLSRVLPLTVLILFAAACSSTPPAQETKPETKAAAEAKPAPAPAPAQAAQPAPRPRGEMGSYNVVRGDHLWGISSKPTIYGNPYQWPLIYKANRDRIHDADVIEPGQVFAIEKKPASSDINAAVQHARYRGAWKIGVVEESDLDYLANAPK